MQKKYSENTALTKRLQAYLSIESSEIKKIVLLTFAMGLLSIATPVAIQALVNVVTMGGVLAPLYVVSFMLFLVLVLLGTFKVLENYIVELMQRRFFVRMAVESAKNVQSSQVSIHDANNYVELMNRFFDVTTLQKTSAILLTSGITALLQATIGSIILMFYSFYFAIMVMMMILAMLFVVFFLGRNGIDTAINESKSKYQMVAWLETLAKNLSAFKFAGGSDLAFIKTDELANQYLEKRRKFFKVILAQNISGVLLYASAGTAMLALGGSLVIRGEINLGQFVAAELIIFTVLASYQKLITQLEYYYDLMGAVDKLLVIETLPLESQGSHVIEINKGLTLNVVNISHRYNEHMQSLRQVNFNLPAGSSLGILGKSGTGKSTLADVITGLRNASSGHVEYNGVDVRQINMQALRQHIGLASKHDMIDGTIYENIALGRPEITVEIASQCLAKVGLLSAVLALEEGLNTRLSAIGSPLSNAQAALLVIARAMASSPKILIIDSLLDGLESDLQETVCQSLLAKDRPNSVLILTRFAHIAQLCDSTLELAAEVQHGI